MTTSTPLRARIAAVRRPLTTLLVGLALLTVILVGGDVYGMATSGSKVSADLDRSSTHTDVVVSLPFEPERYHLDRLGDYGAFAGRGDDASQVRLMRVADAAVDQLSRLYWVEAIDPMPAR